ncbi:amidohydrolase family protein [Streptomyces sp. NBRC 110028]|uniref:amidohydrolase family protein n=1 Tax=Streptomyces sp. NBRC 110028 TaxID=1621260 RepID=UPI0006E3C277|nr:amidohydrolase family protein [Streptomyces sp. NBRC 110028]
MSAQRIDVDAHYFGGSVAALTRAKGLPTALAAASWTPQGALAAMDRHQVATQVLSVPFTATSKGQDAGFARTLCRRINEELAELTEQHPGRFGAFASLPGDDTETMLDELAYALDTLHLDGVSLTSNVAGHYLGSPMLEPVLAELDRRRMPVHIHPADCAHAAELALGRPASLVEFSFDTARNITNALYRGVFLRHPGLRLILSHLGGPLPALAWRIAACTAVSTGPQDTPLTPQHVHDELRGLYYDTAMAGGPHSLLPALQVTGIDHILFGTDAAAAPEPLIADAISELTSTLTGPDLQAVERDNALRLFPRLA